MGQQQLLLTILVTVIVGVAVVVAIDSMQQARKESNESSVRQDMLMILNDAQIYYQKTEMMGGGGSSFDNISNQHILSIEPTNENGDYEISGNGNEVTVVGDGTHEGVELTATATMSGNDMEITWNDSEE